MLPRHPHEGVGAERQQEEKEEGGEGEAQQTHGTTGCRPPPGLSIHGTARRKARRPCSHGYSAACFGS